MVTVPRRIAIVTCSTRQPRVNPFISTYILGILEHLYSGITLETIDIAHQRLPLFDEPVIPARLPEDDPTPHYAKEHSRRWSAVVRQYEGYIFVTPQYNWSVPASLKNALDYLYHEWRGKPAGIVSYGGRGGGKAAEHLRGILNGLRMDVAEDTPALVLNSKTMEYCLENGQVSPEDEARWKNDGVEEKARAMFSQVVTKYLPLSWRPRTTTDLNMYNSRDRPPCKIKFRSSVSIEILSQKNVGCLFVRRLNCRTTCAEQQNVFSVHKNGCSAVSA
jgi:NAD(P)H-dependent FMN reductase